MKQILQMLFYSIAFTFLWFAFTDVIQYSIVIGVTLGWFGSILNEMNSKSSRKDSSKILLFSEYRIEYAKEIKAYLNSKPGTHYTNNIKNTMLLMYIGYLHICNKHSDEMADIIEKELLMKNHIFKDYPETIDQDLYDNLNTRIDEIARKL